MPVPTVQPLGYCSYNSMHPESVERQKKAIDAFAAKHGWGAPKLFIDANVTGAPGPEKREFTALLAHCEANPSTDVIAVRPTSISRDVVELVRLTGELDRTGAQLHFVTELPDYGGLVAERARAAWATRRQKRKAKNLG